MHYVMVQAVLSTCLSLDQQGMIPKVKTCVEAVKAGIRASVILDGRLNNVILKELLSDKGIGTLFRK